MLHGVDVGNILHVVIREPLDKDTDRTRLVFAGEVRSFAALTPLIESFNVTGLIIDEHPEMRLAD